jgi:hypothetical protein
MTGDRPAHVDRCSTCAQRAVELGRWLDQVRNAGMEAADAAFPAERLAAQHTQILRKLENLDQPARVIAFPTHTRSAQEGPRRVAPAWVGIAAAAGLVLGVVSGQLTARMNMPAPAPANVAFGPVQQAPAAEASEPVATPIPTDALLSESFERVQPDALAVFDQLTPSLLTSYSPPRVR